jgi:hypothetical protein
MLIKFGSIVTRGSGKLGGHVFSTNRGGAYIRTNQTPSNPQTSFQQSGRAIFTQLTQGWSALTQAQRDSWSNATSSFPTTDRFGDSRELSGKGLYISLNKERKLIDLPFLDLAPSPQGLVVPTGLDSALSVAVGQCQVLPITQTSDFIAVIKSTGVVSAGTSFVKNKLRAFSTFDGNLPPDPANVYVEYVARFGTPQVGDKVYFSTYTINPAGQRSPEVTDFVIVQ